MNKSPKFRKLKFERMERRECMAGNVTAVLVHGTLTINGDNKDNRIAVTGLGDSGYVVVGIGTTVNGRSTPQFFDRTTRDLVINMNGGNDYVQLANAAVGRDLVIDLGDGKDQLIIANGAVGNNAVVNAGKGNDDLTVNNLSVRYTLAVNGNDGDDIFRVNVNRAKSAFLNGGAGKNTLATHVANDFEFESITNLKKA